MAFKLFGRSHEEPEDKKPTEQTPAPHAAEETTSAAEITLTATPAATAPLTIEQPTQVTVERITQLFKEHGWNYEIDEDGAPYGGWTNGVFVFRLTGEQKEILYIGGSSRFTIPEEKIPEAWVFIEDWHRSKHWPKAYVAMTENDNGERITRIKTEVVIDHEQGATKEQLDIHINIALDTSIALFTELAEQLEISTDEN